MGPGRFDDVKAAESEGTGRGKASCAWGSANPCLGRSRVFSEFLSGQGLEQWAVDLALVGTCFGSEGSQMLQMADGAFDETVGTVDWTNPCGTEPFGLSTLKSA